MLTIHTKMYLSYNLTKVECKAVRNSCPSVCFSGYNLTKVECKDRSEDVGIALIIVII